MSDYDENYFRITGVAWSDADIVCSVAIQPSPSGIPFASGLLVFTAPTGEAAVPDATFQGVIRGDDSGAVADFRLVPTGQGAGFVSFGSYPGCGATMNNYFDTSGSAVTSTPNIGYNIHSGSASVVSWSSYSGSEETESCGTDLNAATLQAFTQGETCTISAT